MKSWEKIFRDDLEIKYGKQETKEDWIKLYKTIQVTSIDLANNNDFEASDELDDELIGIEIILQNEYEMTEQELIEKIE